MFLVKPGPVGNIGFSSVIDSSCSGHLVKWQRLNTGCAVKYNIEFFDFNNVTLGVQTIMDNSSSFCTDHYDNVPSVIMWATFKNETGFKSRLVFLQTTTTTTTTATTPSGKGNTLHKNRCNKWNVLIIKY